MDNMWQITEVPRLVSIIAVPDAPPMPILPKCDKCGERDVDGFLDVNCLNAQDWEECLNEHGIVVGTTLFSVRLVTDDGGFQEGAVCAQCIRNNSWASKALQRAMCVDLLTMVIAGVSLNYLWVAWSSPLRCDIPVHTCPNSLRDIDDCTGWCDFCATVSGFGNGIPCKDRKVGTLPKISVPNGKRVTSLGAMCSCKLTTEEQAYLSTQLSLLGPKRLQKLCVQA